MSNAELDTDAAGGKVEVATITVRAAVVVMGDMWSITGSDAYADDTDLAISALNTFDIDLEDETPQITFITAEIPIQQPQTVEAEVEVD